MEENKQNNEPASKKINLSIPLITASIIIVGVAKQYVFYTNFRVPIKYFLTISDLGVTISDNLLLFAFGFLIFGYVTKLSIHGISKPKAPEYLTEKKQYNFFYKSIVAFAIVFVISLILLFFINIYYFRIALFSIAVFSIITIIFLMEYEFVFSFFATKAVYVYAFISGLVFIVVFFTTGQEIQEIERGQYKGTIVKTSDTTYISNDTSYYIGKNNSFVFFHNTKDTSNWVIPMESVVKILIKQK